MSEDVPVAGRARWWVVGTVAALAVVALAVVLAGAGAPNAGAEGAGTVATPGATPAGEVAGASARADEPSGPGAAVEGASGDGPADQAPPGTEEVPTVIVPIDAVAQLAEAVTARVSDVEAVDGEAVQPGEVAGPALRVTVELTNGSAAPLDLRGAVVNLSHGPQRAPATALTEPGGSPLPHGVDAGATVTGAFVFQVPADARDDLRIELDVRPVGPVVLFAGAAQG